MLRIWGEGLIVAAAVAFVLWPVAIPPAHSDTAIDLALARDCLSGAAPCFGHAASAMNLQQGQGLTRALALWIGRGLPVDVLGYVAALAEACAAAVLYFTLAARFGAAAWLVAGVAPALAVEMAGFPFLWHPTWFALPLALAFAATLATIRTGGMGYAIATGVALALTAESHLLIATLLPVVCVAILLTARQPVLVAGVVASSFVLVAGLISPLSWGANMAMFERELRARPGIALTGVAALTMIAPALLWLRRRVATRGADMRERLVVALWLIAGIAIAVGIPRAVSVPIATRYFAAAWPAIAYAAAWPLHIATRRLPARARGWGALVVFAAATYATAPGAHPPWLSSWTIADATAIGNAAGLAGSSALDIQLGMRPIPPGAVTDIAAALFGTAQSPSAPRSAIRVVRDAGHDIPAGWTPVAAGGTTLYLARIDRWTHAEIAEVCADPAVDGQCIRLGPEDWKNATEHANGAVHRLFQLRLERIAPLIAQWAAAGSESLLWRIPVRATGADGARLIAIDISVGEELVRIDGAISRPHSARSAWVTRPDDGAPAVLIVRTPLGGKYREGFPPLLLELREGEEHLEPLCGRL